MLSSFFSFLEKTAQQASGLARPALAHQIVSLMRDGVQARQRIALPRIPHTAQQKTGERPDGVQLGFAIYQMLEIRRRFQMRNDLAQRLRRKIRDRHDVSRIYGFWRHGNTVTWMAPGTPWPPTDRMARSTSASPKRCVAINSSGKRPQRIVSSAISTAR